MLVVLTVPALAQDGGDSKKNELGLTIGAEVIPQQSFRFGTPATNLANVKPGSSVVFGFNYARRLRTGQKAALYLEFPIFAGPSHALSYKFAPVPVSPAPVPTSLATLYITPSFRVNFKPENRVSPWLSFGGGYAFYEGSEKVGGGISNPDRNTHTGVLQFGGGLDLRTPIKVVKPIGLRAEVRDFHTFDSLNYGLGRAGGQDNLIFAGGLILKF